MKNWGWQIYGLFLTLIVFSSIRGLFTEDSSFQNYYTVLIAFDPQKGILLLSLNIICAFLAVFGPLVVFLYANEIKTPLGFWRVMFWVRLIIDIFGHHYDNQFVRSAFYQSIPFGLAATVILYCPLIPSYVAHFSYAYKKQSMP
jgi:hypothetical protein